jgi:hypothetical protein
MGIPAPRAVLNDRAMGQALPGGSSYYHAGQPAAASLRMSQHANSRHVMPDTHAGDGQQVGPVQIAECGQPGCAALVPLRRGRLRVQAGEPRQVLVAKSAYLRAVSGGKGAGCGVARSRTRQVRAPGRPARTRPGQQRAGQRLPRHGQHDQARKPRRCTSRPPEGAAPQPTSRPPRRASLPPQESALSPVALIPAARSLSARASSCVSGLGRDSAGRTHPNRFTLLTAYGA